MGSNVVGDKLIDMALKDPVYFRDNALSNDLISEIFRGYPAKNLIPLLSNENKSIVKIAIWIFSEIGEKAKSLALEISGLIKSDDRYIIYYSMDAIMLSTKRGNQEYFHQIFHILNIKDDHLSTRASYLIAHANPLQLQASMEWFHKNSNAENRIKNLEFLNIILSKEVNIEENIIRYLKSNEKIDLLYGICLIERAISNGRKFSEKLNLDFIKKTPNIDIVSEEFRFLK